MASNTRLVDRLPPISGKKMQVLALGAPRTGSTSLGDALAELGYEVYGGMKHSFSNENRYPHWSEALDAKYFGKILGNYEALTGWPAVCFIDELLDAYPDAKVILTNRDADQWIESVNKTIYTMLSWRSWDLLLPLSGGRPRDFVLCARRCMGAWTSGDRWNRHKLRQHYLDHYDHVRAREPEGKLLEFDSSDGWGPLCKYLGKDIPEKPFPHTAVLKSFGKSMRMIWTVVLLRATASAVLATGAAGLMIAVAWYYKALHR